MSPPVVRVLAVSHPSGLYGAQLHLLRLAPHLRARGVELTLAAPPGDPLASAWQEAGHPFVALELPMHRRASGADRTSRSLAQRVGEGVAVLRSIVPLTRLARRFDVVVSHSLTAHLEVAVAGRLVRTPTVLELVDMVQPGLGRVVLRCAAGLARTTIANSAATATALGRARGVRIVHPGVDLERFAPGPCAAEVRASLGGVDDAPLVGIVGRVDPRKGVHVLVEAMAHLEGDAAAARLAVVGETVVGTPTFAAELRETARAQLGERVTFAGRRDDIVEVLRSLDVLVNASLAEPFGLSILEAQAVGLPVVAPRTGGVPEFVEDGVTGVLVPPFDVAQLAAGLQRLLTDDDLRNRISEAGQRRAIERHGLERNYDEIATIYRDATRRHATRRRAGMREGAHR